MRRHPQAWLAVFVVVVFSGGLGAGLLLRPYLESTPSAKALLSSSRERSSAELMAILAKELDLTPAQRTQIEAVVNARREVLGAFRQGVQKHLDDERLATMADIERILTPEQRRRFEAFIASRRDGDGHER